MKTICVTLTYEIFIEVPKDTTCEEINHIVSGKIPEITSKDLVDVDWEFMEGN